MNHPYNYISRCIHICLYYILEYHLQFGYKVEAVDVKATSLYLRFLRSNTLWDTSCCIHTNLGSFISFIFSLSYCESFRQSEIRPLVFEVLVLNRYFYCFIFQFALTLLNFLTRLDLISYVQRVKK